MSKNKYNKHHQNFEQKKSTNQKVFNNEPVLKDSNPSNKNQKVNAWFALYQKYPHAIWLFVILVVTFISYFPVLDNDFMNWDDDRYVTLNKNIQELSIKNIIGYFTDYYFVLYLPLPLLTYAIEYYFSGLDPFPYHFNNLLLHLLNTLLVYVLVYRLIDYTHLKNATRIAVIAAFIFVVFSFHVQSIAWISERKDLLYTAFYLWGLVVYLKFLRSKSVKTFLAVLFIFLLSLFSKGQAVTFSVVLVVLDYYFGRNLLSKQVIVEKIPFFVLSIIFGVVNLMAYATNEPFAESTAQLTSPETRTFFENIIYSCYGYMMYLFKTIVPFDLASIYPYPEKNDGMLQWYFWVLPIPVVAISASIIYFFKKSKEIVFGILFFSISITLILQIIADQPFIIMDHYSYVSSIGIIFLMSFGIDKAISLKEKLKTPLYFLVAIYIVFNMVYTMNRVNVWQTPLTFWDDLISKYPSIVIAHYNRGNYNQELGDKAVAENSKQSQEYYKTAIADYTNAINYDLKNVGAYSNRGITSAKLGDAQSALTDFNKVIQLDSNYANVYSNRGNSKVMLGDMKGAISDYNRAIAQKPDYLDAYVNRANARINIGDNAGASTDFSKVLELQPSNISAHVFKGMALLNMNQLDEAFEYLNKAIGMDPKNFAAFYYRGLIKEKKGDVQGAKDDYAIAYKLNPKLIQSFVDNGSRYESMGNVQAAFAEYEKGLNIAANSSELYVARGVLKGRTGNLKAAIDDFNLAIQYNPQMASAYSNRGFAKNLSGDLTGALQDYSKAIELNPQFSTAYHNRGLLKINSKEFASALADFEKAIEFNPNFAESYFNRAICRLNQNMKDAACQDFQMALKLGMASAQEQINKICGVK